MKKVIQIGNFLKRPNRANPNQGRVYSVFGLAPCLNICNGGGRQPYIIVKVNNNKVEFI